MLYSNLLMAHQPVALLAKQAPGETRQAVTRRLERFQLLLKVLLAEGCRREHLQEAVLGPELACQCPPCTTCDRCSGDGGTCEVTAGTEASVDLRGAARKLGRLLMEQPRTLLDCGAWSLRRALPAAVGTSSGCAQLVLLMLAQRLLYLEPTSSGGVVVCAREDPDKLEAMRESPFCGLASAMAPLLGSGSGSEAEHAELDQLLEEVDVMERRVARSQATLEAMRRRCVHLALRLGRRDVLELA